MMPVAPTASPVESPRAPEVASPSVQQTPFGNVAVTPRPPPVRVAPPAFTPPPAAAPAPAPAAPVSKSGGSTGLIVGVVAVAIIAGGAFVFMGKGKNEASAPVAASAADAVKPGAAQAPQALTSKEILNQILGLVRDNRWQDVKPKVNSLKELVQVTKGNRANSEKLTQEALKLLESNSTSEAISLFEKAIAEDSSYFGPRSLLGRTLSRSGKPEVARLVLIDALVMEPDRGGTWFSAAEMFAEIGKPEISADALKLAVHFAANRESAMKLLEDKTQFPSAKFWAVVENNRSVLNGVPAYK